MGDPLACSCSTNAPACYVEQLAANITTGMKYAVASLVSFVGNMADAITDARTSIWSPASAMSRPSLWNARVPFVFDTNSVPDVTQTVPATHVDRLDVQHDTGMVHIVGTGTDMIEVRAYERESSPSCATKVTAEGNTMVVKTENALFDPGPCNVDVALVIPSGLAVTAAVRKGLLHLNNLAGPLALKVGVGKLFGDISSSNVEVRTGLGELFLRWTLMPPSGDVEIRAGATDTTLEFPPGTIVAPTVHSGLSDVQVGVATNPAAAFKIRVKTGLADLRMRYSQ